MRRSTTLIAALALAALAVAGPRVAAADGAALIPRATLFGNAPRDFPQVSPDGKRISWLAPDAQGVQNVWVQSVTGGDSAKAVTHESHRPIYFYRWAADSRRLLYLQDGDGDENNHLFSADLETGVVRDLTPFRGVRAQNVLVSLEHPGVVLLALNLRDRRAFDMHRIDLETGAVTLEARNPGDVLTWSADWDFVIRGATAFDPATCNTVIRVRDGADFDPQVQLLANRGYAVLQVNYRGSTGFGLAFLNASTHEWGRGTQLDLYDAVKWAVAQGIADPKRVAAMGWSGGGYATLLALEQRPDVFTCGVDGVGPGDLRTLFASFPTYWDGILARWRRRVGDVEHDDALNRERSPIYHVDAIRDPLLVGQGKNDPRVKLATADAMVKALRDAGREVTYVVYPDEGHGFARPENQLDFFGRVEEFLAKHLGGRAESWAKLEGATAELK